MHKVGKKVLKHDGFWKKALNMARKRLQIDTHKTLKNLPDHTMRLYNEDPFTYICSKDCKLGKGNLITALRWKKRDETLPDDVVELRKLWALWINRPPCPLDVFLFYCKPTLERIHVLKMYERMIEHVASTESSDNAVDEDIEEVAAVNDDDDEGIDDDEGVAVKEEGKKKKNAKKLSLTQVKRCIVLLKPIVELMPEYCGVTGNAESPSSDNRKATESASIDVNDNDTTSPTQPVDAQTETNLGANKGGDIDEQQVRKEADSDVVMCADTSNTNLLHGYVI
jgi:hypothetical protein